MATEFISNSWLMPTNANAEANRVSNYSLDFDGSSQYIDFTEQNYSGAFSMSFWVNPIEFTSNNRAFLVSDDTNNHFIWLLSNTDIRLKINGSQHIFTESGGNDIVPSTWQNITITRDDSNNVNCFRNSLAFGSSGSISGTFDINKIARAYAGNWMYQGKITEASVFDYALSASQVTELYGTGSAIGNPMAITNGRKPVAYYPLGNAAFNGEFLAPNSAEKDYVFDFLAAPTYSRISLGTSDFIGNKSISFWLNKNVNNGSIFAFGNTNYYPNVQSTTLQLNNGSTTILSTGTINLNEWNHYVITGDGTTAKCYVNGVYKSTGIDRDISSAANWIGGQNNGTGMLNGKLSNIQKWDVVLSDGGVSIGDIAGGDISTLYNYGTPYKGTQPQSANLQAWWELDASATFDGSNWSIPDASSNSNTGTSSGMTAANLVQSDLIINAPYDSFSLQMDGADEYIDCGASSFSGETGISVSVWVYPTAVGTAQAEAIISTDVSSTAPRGFYLALYASNKIRWQIGTTVYNSKNSLDVTNTLQLNQWNHLVGTWNATTMSVYINGSLAGDEPSGVANGTFNSTNNILIGARETTGGYFPGRISNAAIFKSTLSAAQVLELYNENKPFDLNNFSVTANNWWRLGSVNTFYNSTTTEFTVLDELGTNNGTSVNMEQGDLVSGVGATGSGTSSGMSSGTNRTGDAPYSENNAVSYNMSVTAKSTSVPT